jgi:hypothetical protein
MIHGMETAATPEGEAAARLLRRWVAEGERWLDVDGRSMSPTISPPARVLVVARARPRRGEVWAFVGGDRTVVVHRYVRRAGEGCQFKGDGSESWDPPVAQGRLVGRVVAAADGRGYHRFGALDRLVGSARLTRWRLRRSVHRHRR